MTKRTSGMENTILHSRVSEGQGLLRNTIKHCAFTLAEVLITLAIIGVVAALTIPTVVHKYQQKQLYTQFMKTYNTLTSAMELIESESESKSWDWENGNPFSDYIVPQLKVSKVCDNYADCFASEYKWIGGNGDASEFAEGYAGDHPIILADGSVIGADGSDTHVFFVVDTNGKKGPNIYGRDLFQLWYSTGKEYKRGFNLNPENNNTCDPTNPNSEMEDSDGCMQKMITEGKMDY